MRGGLFLDRRVGESIQIGNGVIVTVESIGRHETRLRVVAPKDVPIVRTELLSRPANGERRA